MKVEINEKKTQGEVKYPCLMKYNNTDIGHIILFINRTEGVVIEAKRSGWLVGDYATDLSISQFKPFNGTITLSNDQTL